MGKACQYCRLKMVHLSTSELLSIFSGFHVWLSVRSCSCAVLDVQGSNPCTLCNGSSPVPIFKTHLDLAKQRKLMLKIRFGTDKNVLFCLKQASFGCSSKAVCEAIPELVCVGCWCCIVKVSGAVVAHHMLGHAGVSWWWLLFIFLPNFILRGGVGDSNPT